MALTILTPTYNRANRLTKLYESLCSQTCKDFQWLVIDDGSQDKTFDLIKCFAEQNKILTDYRKKDNGGKHTALNYSHSHIKGKYTVIVDSDDYLVSDAVERILAKWKKYSEDDSIAGITFQRGKPETNEAFDQGIIGEFASTFSEEMNKGMCGDHCETVRSDLFIKFRFPEYANERFVAEGAMWYSVTKGYKVIYSDEIICLAEYLEGGLTKSGRFLHIKNPKGCMWHASVFLNHDFNLKIRLKNAMLYVCYKKFVEKDKTTMLQDFTDEKLLVQAMRPAGWILYHYWRLKYLRGA